MYDLLFESDDSSTPLTLDEQQGLKPSYITTRQELNEAEQRGIAVAEEWAFARKRKDAAEVAFLVSLHKRMYKDVWKWAGTYSKQAKRNIGLDHYAIPSALQSLVSDVHFWIDNVTYEPDQIAARFHHRLVYIHPFPNGNGRWARLAADMLIVQLGRPRFTWGRINLTAVSEVRKRYIAALKAADNFDMQPLLSFVRT